MCTKNCWRSAVILIREELLSDTGAKKVYELLVDICTTECDQ
jgi:hypothetical protein